MRMPSLVVLVWLAVALSALPEALRWWRSSRSAWQMRWAADTNAPPVGFLIAARAPAGPRDDAVLAGSRRHPISFAWTMTEARRR